MTTQKDVGEAKAAAATAAEALAVEEKRLRAARADFQKLTEDVEEADPDATKGFAQLVAARDVARARVDALSTRERKARAASEAATEQVAAADRAAKESALAELDGRIAEKDGELTAAVVAFKAQLAADIAKLHQLRERANGLHMELGGWNPLVHRNRGAYWLQEGQLHHLMANPPPPR